VEAACEEAKSFKLKKVGIFGTRFTMQQRFYPDVFSRAGIALVAPELDEQDYIHDKYMNELLKGMALPETREGLLMIVDRMLEQHRIDGLILGGTELPLVLKEAEYHGIPFLDTTRIHVKYVVTELLKE
jgi:aspartate racemase